MTRKILTGRRPRVFISPRFVIDAVNPTERENEAPLDIPATDDSQLHDLLPFDVGGRIFAVFAEHVEGTAERKPFAPLPHAPKTVLGVVCVRGRMLTVVDASTFLNQDAVNWSAVVPYVIALRGDEQLGLAAERCRDTVTIAARDIEPFVATEPTPDGLIVGLVKYAGEEIAVLNCDRLFNLAVQRRERRRRRF